MRPTKKWLAPATASSSVAVQPRVVGRDLVRRPELVVRGQHEQLRARVVSDRVVRGLGAETQRRRDPDPTRDARVVDGERHVGAERPADERERSGGARARRRGRSGFDRGEDVERFVRPFGVGALAVLDAPEVEAQARDAVARQGFEQAPR